MHRQFGFYLGLMVCVWNVTFADGLSYSNLVINFMLLKQMFALEIAASNLFLPKNAKGGDCWRLALA